MSTDIEEIISELNLVFFAYSEEVYFSFAYNFVLL